MSAGILANLLKVPKEQIGMVVDFVDLDGDGFLDEYDFVCMVGLFTKGTMQEKLQSIFYLFDEDFSQIISKQELQKLVTCILCINKGNEKISQAEVEQKMKDIQEDLFQVAEPELKMAEFLEVAVQDSDFRTALVKIGIFREEEGKQDCPQDLLMELEKGQEDIREEDQVFENRKMGLEQKIGDFQVQEADADQFMAVKPFLGVVKNSVPSGFNEKKVNLNEPDANLELEFVHGYRSFDTRNNIFFIDENSILFHTAAIGVVMDTKRREQKFNLTNTDDIICIAKHQDLVATGQIGNKPIINLWSCSS